MIHVIENFLPNADAIRAHALQSNYIDWPGPDGEVYKRISIQEISGLREGVEKVLGPVTMLGMAFRLNFNAELPNAAIHSDMGWGSHALVLPLSEGSSGTAFWKHKKTGAWRIDPGDVELFELVKSDWNDIEAWEVQHFVDMKFNRAVIYESSLFHSRFPFEAFGDSPETGRLIAVAFFTPESEL